MSRAVRRYGEKDTHTHILIPARARVDRGSVAFTLTPTDLQYPGRVPYCNIRTTQCFCFNLNFICSGADTSSPSRRGEQSECRSISWLRRIASPDVTTSSRKYPTSSSMKTRLARSALAGVCCRAPSNPVFRPLSPRTCSARRFICTCYSGFCFFALASPEGMTRLAGKCEIDGSLLAALCPNTRRRRRCRGRKTMMVCWCFTRRRSFETEQLVYRWWQRLQHWHFGERRCLKYGKSIQYYRIGMFMDWTIRFLTPA